MVRRPPDPPETPRPGRDAIERWFADRGWTPWLFQRDAWDAYARRESGLIQVATGAGKTYAAYLGPLAALIDEVRAHKEGSFVPGLRILYVTPLRAVSRDIELALREPVRDLGLPVRVESRTGDTASSVRARQRERLPEVLITTPESLMLLLTREDAREKFGRVSAVIVDEWHELLASKRGTQVELGLARVRAFSPDVRTWALSATLPNLDEAAAAVVGARARPAIVRGEMARPVVIDSVLPRPDPRGVRRLPWAGHLGLSMLPEVVDAIDPRVSTLLFTNTRSQAERWYHAILVARPEWASIAALHHGSIDRGERERVEGGLKDGSVRLVVATSSLDLGVDFAPVERVFQVGSPKGIARLVQRAGRSSHRPRTPCRITCVPTHMLELVEIAAARRALAGGWIEARAPMSKPLDVLAQHLVSCALGGGFVADELFEEVRGTWSYRGLTREEFEWCLTLVREGGALSAYERFHRVGEVGGRHRVVSELHARQHRLNVGTITGDATIDIRFANGRSLGRIEEGFVAGLREGQKFVFAGRVLRFVGMHDLTAIVRPATGTTSLTPIWSGTRLPISESLAQGIRETLEAAANGVADTPELALAMDLVRIQSRESIVPRAGEVLVESTRTREGHHLFVYPFEGRLVHAGIAALLALRLGRLERGTFAIAANDYGFELLSPVAYPFERLVAPGLFEAEALAQDIAASMDLSRIARLQFREVARVAGLVAQNYPGQGKSSRQVQASAGLIFDVLSEFDPGNLLLEQARREVLERHFERSRLGRTLERLRGSRWRMVTTARPTPLSLPLIVERQAAKLSTQSIVERIEQVRSEWERQATPSPSVAAARSRRARSRSS